MIMIFSVSAPKRRNSTLIIYKMTVPGRKNWSYVSVSDNLKFNAVALKIVQGRNIDYAT